MYACCDCVILVQSDSALFTLTRTAQWVSTIQLQLDSSQLTSNDAILLQAKDTATTAAALKLHRTSWPDGTTDTGVSLSNVQLEAVPTAWAALRAWARADATAAQAVAVSDSSSSSSSSSSSAAAIEPQAYRWTVKLSDTAITATIGESQYAVTLTAELTVSNGAFCNGPHSDVSAAAAAAEDCVVNAVITHLNAHVCEQSSTAAVRSLLLEPVQRGRATVVLSTNGRRHVECALGAVQLQLRVTDAALMLACYRTVSSSSSFAATAVTTGASDVVAVQQEWRVTATVGQLSVQLIDDSSIHFERCAEQQLVTISTAALTLEYSLESLSIQLQELHILDHLQPDSSRFRALLTVTAAVNSDAQHHDSAVSAVCSLVYNAASPQCSAVLTVTLATVTVNWNSGTIAALWQFLSALQICTTAAQQQLLNTVVCSSAVSVKGAMHDAVRKFLLLETEQASVSNTGTSSNSTGAVDSAKQAATVLAATGATAVSANVGVCSVCTSIKRALTDG
jgi:hypothetical protein